MGCLRWSGVWEVESHIKWTIWAVMGQKYWAVAPGNGTKYWKSKLTSSVGLLIKPRGLSKTLGSQNCWSPNYRLATLMVVICVNLHCYFLEVNHWNFYPVHFQQPISKCQMHALMATFQQVHLLKALKAQSAKVQDFWTKCVPCINMPSWQYTPSTYCKNASFVP